MTKRELIDFLEALDVPDDLEVVRADYEYQHVTIAESSLSIENNLTIWVSTGPHGQGMYEDKYYPTIVIN